MRFHHLGDRLAAYVDGELPRGTRELVAAHLAMCSSCRAAAAAQARTKQVLSGLGAPQPSGGLLDALLELAAPGEPLPPRRQPLGRSGPAPVPLRPRPSTLHVRPRSRPARARRSFATAGAAGIAAVALAAANTGGTAAAPTPARAVEDATRLADRSTVGPDVTRLVGIEAGPAAGPATFSGVFFGHVHAGR